MYEINEIKTFVHDHYGAKGLSTPIEPELSAIAHQWQQILQSSESLVNEFARSQLLQLLRDGQISIDELRVRSINNDPQGIKRRRTD